MIDLVDYCRSTYEKIPKYIKRSFLIIFFSSLVVFSFSIIHYFLGREDWLPLVDQTDLFNWWDMTLGRYFTRFLHFFIFDGYACLPIIGKLFVLFMLSIASIMLGVYWRLPKNTLYYSLLGIVIILQPYILGVFYFAVGTEMFLVLPFFLMLGLLLCEKAKDFRLWYKILLLVCSALCFWFIFGTYPVLINTLVVIFIGRILIDFIIEKDKKLLHLISSHMYAIVAIAVGLLLHFAVISWLRQKGILRNEYNSSLIGMSEWPVRMWVVIKAAFRYLSCYRISFFPDFFTWTWTFLLCFAGGSSVLDFIREKCKYNKRVINIIIFVLLFSCALFGTLCTNVISKGTTFFRISTDFFGIAFFHALILAVLFNINRVIIKNVTFLCCIVLLWICTVQDFNIQKVWYFGFEAEKAQWFRIIDRIETNPEFNADKSYRLLILGATEPYRPYFYVNRKKSTVISNELLTFSFMPCWGNYNLTPLNHYSAYGYKGKWMQIAMWDPVGLKQALESFKDELIKAEPWPALTSVQIKNDIILLVLDKNTLAEAKTLINLN